VTPTVKAVILDYGGVLRSEDTTTFDEFASGFGLPPGTLWAAFHHIPEYRLSRTGVIGASAYREAVLGHLATLLPRDRAEAALSQWEALRSQDAPIEPAMAALLDRLRGQVRLGLLSNAGKGARARLEAEGVAQWFDDVVCSGDVGLAKPDPAIFRLAARRLDAEPSACAFLDDQPEHVESARSIGMRAHRHDARRIEDTLAFLRRAGLNL
jgi:putative hydrolase of the HAD superfamily